MKKMIAVIVNMIYHTVYKNYIVKDHTSESGEYITEARALSIETDRVANSSRNPKQSPLVTIETKIVTKKDRYSGSVHDVTQHHVTERHTIQSRDIIKSFGEYLRKTKDVPHPLEHIYMHLHRKHYDPVLGKDVFVEESSYKGTSYNINNMIPIIIVPAYIPKVGDFWTLVFDMMSRYETYTVIKDLDNYICVHNGKIQKTTSNGMPGMKMTDTSLNYIWSKIMFNKAEDKELRKLKIDYKLLRNPYYLDLIDKSIKIKNTYLLDLINARNGLYSPEQRHVDLALMYNEVFNMLDITVPTLELPKEKDQFVFKIHFLSHLRVRNRVSEFIDLVRDEFRADSNMCLLNKVLKANLTLDQVYEEPIYPINDGDYVVTDLGSVVLKDDNNPHDEYMKEEEGASAPSASPLILGEDYEVLFEDLGGLI